ncbi:MAG TPA: hypothetical protein VN203_22190 [Candidatus Acidoferrum sp.]|nr:hypothetical protein [Candidatus Acidoferrum sp.]
MGSMVQVRRALTFFFVGVCLLIQADGWVMAAATPQETAQEAEAALKSAMEAWAYEQYWRLWDMGSKASRSALTQEEFTQRMRSGNARPAAGRQVEAIQVVSTLPESALLQVRFGLEDRYRPWTESTDRPFVLLYEEGRWTVSLWDFISLANYFPPIFLPNPLLLPPPNPPRSRGPMR